MRQVLDEMCYREAYKTEDIDIEKINFMKIYAFDEIIKHLIASQGDNRDREKRRVQVAFNKINSWAREGGEVYEKERRNKSKVENKAKKI